jgi:flagellar assembly factor FliW
MLGFEDLREFVLISDEETVPFRWLISIEKPEIGFPVLSPWYIDLSYNPGRDFNIDREVIFAVITLEDERGHMSANMKAPVILDVMDHTGRQVILPTDKYLPNFIIPNK